MTTRLFTPGLLLALALLLLGSACATEPETLPPGDYAIKTSARALRVEAPVVPVRRAALALPTDSVKHHLKTRFEQDALAGLDGNEAVRQSLERFYAARGFEPAWLDGRSLSLHAEALIADLCLAEEEALLPAAYRPDLLRQALDRVAEDPTSETLAALDLHLSRAFMQYTDDLLAGRIDPEVLDSEVYLERPVIALDSVLEEALRAQAPASFGRAMQPEHPHFARLREALDHYRQLADDGGWPTVTVDDVLEPSMEDGVVPTLRRRLAITGDLPEAHAQPDSLYDEQVATAVARFQRRHGLLVDSLVGPATAAALNVSAEDRVRQIERNIERWRWLPRDLTGRYILVNIPAFMVYGYDAGQQALAMRVVVGSEYGGQQTPVFSDRMDHVVFRPYWNVPYSIASGEILPKARGNLAYLARNDYEIVGGSEVVSPSAEALDKVAEGTYRIRQKPGPSNALGLIKFMFPNRHAIYLHDTPADHLFDRYERDFSHGCIRLEDPPRFAEYVLGRQGWTPERIDAAINTGDRQDVRLDAPIPVYLMYLTAFAHDDGTVAFYDDIYGFDEALDAALAERTRRAKAAAKDTETVCQTLQRIRQRR